MEEGDNQDDYIETLESEVQNQAQANEDLTNQMNSLFANKSQDNSLQWRLSTDDILERLENFLKGAVAGVDEEGNVVYKESENNDVIILNEYGVNSCMHILGNYVHRGITLSYYDAERINEILADLGDELADFIECNYDKMGMDNQYKKSRYILLVLNILHIVEASFRRALKGKEREYSAPNLLMTENLGNRTMQIPQMPKKKKVWPFG